MLSLWLALACGPTPAIDPAPPPLAEAPAAAVPLVQERSHDLQARIDAASAGTPANRLVLSDSPYLRQHAHNPVDWFPWGEEAFALARQLGRPVLLSVGYATCHWCHVMEEESFEDEEIATYLNTHYVPIKVDREQLPHVDRTYMAAVQAMGLRGGWPMTVWLTPERAPYYAATYLPARDGDRGGQRGFLTALRQLVQVYEEEHDQLQRVSADLVTKVRQQLAPRPSPTPVTMEAVHARTEAWLRRVDPVHGGIQGRPSFPGDLPMRWLLTPTGGPHDDAARVAALLTLRAIDRSGLHDQLAGGFHRYSVDDSWDVPHFEKMLYDNADLADLYLLAWRRTGDEALLATARRTLGFLDRQMSTPEGGFVSALDADSLDPDTGARREGWFYTWTRAELEQAVGPATPEVLAAFGVEGSGAIEGRHVLRRAQPRAAWGDAVEPALPSLLAARSHRPPPSVDGKEVVAWNALAIRAFARAGTQLSIASYTERAARAADRLWSDAQTAGRVRRQPSPAAPAGELDDHALLAAACVDLFEATADPRWLHRARTLDDTLQARFAHPGGGWYATADDADPLLERAQPQRDGPHPSGASVHLVTLQRLAALTGDERYRARAARGLTAYADALRRGRMDHGLLAVAGQEARWAEIVLVVPTHTGEAHALQRVIARHAPPWTVQLTVPEAEVAAVAEVAPPVRGKVAREGLPTAYVCEQGVCQAPVTDPAALEALLRRW